MSWQQIKALREQRAEHRNGMNAILAKAETEKRDLTADETKRFDGLAASAEAASKQIDRYEQVRSLGSNNAAQAAAAAAIAAGLDPDAGMPTQSRATNDDTSETRALRKGESCVEFLRGRGLIGQDEKSVGLGAFLRSALVGPRTEAERRALSQLSLGAGGYTTNAYLSAEWIDSLNAASVVSRAGARLVPMLSDKHHIARVATPPAASWVPELGDVPESTAAFDRVELAAKNVVCQVRCSRELLQDSLNIENILQTTMAAAVAREIDRVALIGNGTSSQPTGVSNTSGIGSVSMGTDGGALISWGKLQDAAYEIAVDNGGTPTAMVAHPRTALALDKLVDANGNPLSPPPSLRDLPLLTTTALSVTEAQGTANNASRVIVGDFSRLLVGVRLAPQIEITPGPLLDSKLQVGFVVWARIDIAVEQASAFSQLVGITPA